MDSVPHFHGPVASCLGALTSLADLAMSEKAGIDMVNSDKVQEKDHCD